MENNAQLSDFQLHILEDSEQYNYMKIINILIEKGYLDTRGFLTEQGKEVVKAHHAFKEQHTEEDINQLVETLRDIYPIGIKAGTTKSWRSTPKEITKKLYSFFRKYPEITSEEVIIATKKYVNISNPTYRRTLAYFIEKDGNSDLYETIIAYKDAKKNGAIITETSSTENDTDWGYLL